MLRKMSFVFAITSMISLSSFVGLAMVQGGDPNCPSPIIKVDQSRIFNSQALGNGVEVTWKTERLLPCSGIKTLSVTVFLETAKGEKLTLKKEVSSGLNKALLTVPASKVHVFLASDAKTKITPVVAVVRDHRG